VRAVDYKRQTAHGDWWPVTLSDTDLRCWLYVKCSAKGKFAVKVDAFLFSQSQYLSSLLLLCCMTVILFTFSVRLNNYKVLQSINIPNKHVRQSVDNVSRSLPERKAPGGNSTIGGSKTREITAVMSGTE
jgi:hypothetical protein